ncbi:ATP-binding protein [Pseudobacteriovorax antillogorgiicola]|uniref:histidine kinase n=1 Tax=Pseudobacteriovorax antillogorgiicola TaxID=1513793 RepID=A0A1Y6BRU8_9BACT|nr:ATP-binding protein [Pseudobacteriovorax antillogorgiicola]TCS54592.1 extracellular solute-binding protein (family 5) [Pseudobacteriovorax antillogorgiicola]SMF17718.1 extracellular solute-binding protein, family 5 Middle [Pseudobacteriovorax antillogorgiicola]
MTKRETLYVYTKRLPQIDEVGHWIHELIRYNCSDRLMEFDGSGEPRPSLLETCAVSGEGSSFRIHIKKNAFFHDGTEIKASHVIQSLIDFASQSSEGFRRVLRYEDLEKNFKKISRHRLEVSLQRSVPDFMNYLAMSGASIVRQDKKGVVDSGTWQLDHWDDEEIELHWNEQHWKGTLSLYDRVIIRPFECWENHNPGQPYLHLYHGVERKTPKDNFLHEQINSILPYQFATFMLLKDENSGLKQKLHGILEQALKKKSYWERSCLESLAHEHSPLYSPVHVRKQGVNHQVPDSLTILVEPNDFPIKYLNFLKDTFAEQGVKVSFKEGVLSRDLGGCDGVMVCLGQAHHKDSFSIINKLLNRWRCVLPNHTSTQLLKKASTAVDLIRRCQLFRDFVNHLNQTAYFIPMVKVECIVASNRIIDMGQSGHLRFVDVKQSVKQTKDDELKHAALSAIGSAVQMFAHDVKKPFSMIQGFVSLISSLDDPEKVRQLSQKHLPRIRQTIKEVDGLIYDIVEIGANSEVIQEPISLHELIDECLTQTINLEGQVEHTVRLNIQHQRMVDGDQVKLQRVFANILGNAQQACPKGGEIWVETRLDQQTIHITIGNTGSFIPEEQREQIFEAFYTKGKKRGTGLGLAIAKKIVDGHGGRISCYSDETKGTEFRIELPAANKADAVRVEYQPIEGDSGREIKILLADDDQSYLELVRDILASLSYEALQIDVAMDIATVLKMVEDNHYNLMIVDIDFGDHERNGFDVLTHIRSQGRKSLVCLHSDGGALTYQKRALRGGADLFLPKPINRRHLERMVQSCYASLENPETTNDLWIVVDDDPFFLAMWEESELQPKTFSEPEQALEYAKSHQDVKGYILDYYFDNSSLDGLSLAKQIRGYNSQAAIYLCTDRPGTQPEEDFIDVLPKDISKALDHIRRVHG